MDSVKDRCEQFALKNFQAISLQEKFKTLDAQFISRVIMHSDLQYAEAVKCKALLIWANHDVDNRTKTFTEIFESIDCKKIPTRNLRYLVENEPIVKESARCLRHVCTSLQQVRNVRSEDINLDQGCTGLEEINVFNKTSNSIEVFGSENNPWTTTAIDWNVEFNSKRFTALLIQNEIFVFFDDGSNYRLNYLEDGLNWTPLEERNIKLRVQVVAFGGGIYAFEDHRKASNDVERFDLSNSTWSPVSPKPYRGYGVSIVKSGEFIYCIGGYDGNSLNNVRRFSPSNHSIWHALPPMPTARYQSSAAELNGRIYVMGGRNGDYFKTVECFDTYAKEWAILSDMQNPRHAFRSCVIAGKIYVIGGERSRDTIEEYDPENNSWEDVGNLTGREIEPLASIVLSNAPR